MNTLSFLTNNCTSPPLHCCARPTIVSHRPANFARLLPVPSCCVQLLPLRRFSSLSSETAGKLLLLSLPPLPSLSSPLPPLQQHLGVQEVVGASGGFDRRSRQKVVATSHAFRAGDAAGDEGRMRN
eukprot:514608-Hanusia_phi.AAC.1